MSLPSQYQLVSLFYQCKIANPTLNDAQCLNDVKDKWQKAAAKLKTASDPREYEMTPAEIIDADNAAAADEAAQLALVAQLDNENTIIENYLNSLTGEERASAKRKPYEELKAAAGIV